MMPKSFLIAREEEEDEETEEKIMPSKSDTNLSPQQNVKRSASTAQDSELTRVASANEEWKSSEDSSSRNLWLDTLDTEHEDFVTSDEDQNDLDESNESHHHSQSSTLPPSSSSSYSSSKDVCATSHGMTSSELGQVIRADHDYIELLVKVKAEEESEEEMLEEIPEEIDIKEEIIEPANASSEKNPEMFDNLATLAEVSLATAGLPGQLVDKSLKREIDQARAKIKQTILPVTPEMSSKRTMQITLPENTTHIVICTSADSTDASKSSEIANNNNNNNKKEVIRTVVKTNNRVRNGSGLLVSDSKNADRKGTEHHDYECGECGKTYSTSSNLARHKQTHRSLSDKKAKRCTICGKIYVSMPAYAMHLRTHNQNCKCSICGKTFSRPWLLQGHLRTHTGERPYKCNLCPKAFADKSNLRAHTQTHSNSKPFECRHCGKTFALKSYLYKHEEASCNQSK